MGSSPIVSTTSVLAVPRRDASDLRWTMAGEVWRRSAELFVEDGWFEHSTWLGVPVWHLPQDLVALQQVIVEQRPALIVSTGFGGGGTPIFLASVQQLVGLEPDVVVIDGSPSVADWALADHPLGAKVEVIAGRAPDPAVLELVDRRVSGAGGSVLVVLGSSPTRADVQVELDALARFVPVGGWLVVFGGSMQWVAAAGLHHPRVPAAWNWATDNALVATEKFVARSDEFEVHDLGAQLGATFAPKGYLRRVK